ncbi:cell division cycle 20.2, cofactor of APC complex-like [Cocos nucifera]|nr:cell division cycle 20.2, cofactor of APC complex-like [Cocos nucifera]
MGSPLMRLREHQWYSPSSSKFACPVPKIHSLSPFLLFVLEFFNPNFLFRLSKGDRFIPTRSLMNLDLAQSLLWERLPEKGDRPEILTATDEYRRKLREELTLDSEGKPFKMLPFRGILRTCKNVLHAEEMMQERFFLVINGLDWGKSNILAVALGPSVYLWNAEKREVKLLRRVNDEEDHPTSVAWSGDGKTLAVGFASSRIELWDVASSRQVRILEGHTSRVGSLSWNRNILTSGSHDASIINHDVRSIGRSARHVRGHTEEVCGLRWSGAGDLLASGGNDNLVHVWEPSYMGSSKYLRKFTDHRAPVCALEWNRHEKEILSAHGYGRNRLSLWAYPSMSKIVDLSGHAARVLYLTQSPDGSTVVSAAADERLCFWKVFEPPPLAFSRKRDEENSGPLSLKRLHIR